jgi:two-component system, OmpR family, sensor kinase
LSAAADPRARRPRRFSSARTRILTAILVLLVASEAVALLVQREILISRAGERIDDALVQEVDEFRRLVRQGRDPLNQGRPFGGDVRRIFDVFLARNVPSEREAIFTFLGERPYRSTVGEPLDPGLRDALVRLGRVAEPTRADLDVGDERARYVAVPVVVEGRRRGAFVVTVDLEGEEAEVDDAVRITAGVSIAVLLLAAVVAWLLAGRMLRPVRELTDTAQAITESDLTRRIEVRGSDEIAELARTFNGMLDRLEAAFASQRGFVSDAGHELRTPITIIRGHLELLDDDPVERAATVALVTDELDRMSRFVDDLLTLAKAERTDFLRLEDVDLDVLTQELMAKAAALAPRDWRLETIGAGRLRADRQRLTQAMMNLAGNAVQHTRDGDTIRLGSELRDGHALLWVADEGPGVPHADQERVFERFARASGGPRRSDGAGLGLAIVRAIAEAHGGRVTLRSEPGRGATFTVEVPA